MLTFSPFSRSVCRSRSTLSAGSEKSPGAPAASSIVSEGLNNFQGLQSLRRSDSAGLA